MAYIPYSRQLPTPRDSKQQVFEFFEDVLSQIDLKKLLRDSFLDGFETYDDYEKYGDMF